MTYVSFGQSSIVISVLLPVVLVVLLLLPVWPPEFPPELPLPPLTLTLNDIVMYDLSQAVPLAAAVMFNVQLLLAFGAVNVQ
jgi:hypothetical protein